MPLHTAGKEPIITYYIISSSDWHGSFRFETCDFVTYTSKGIFVVKIYFNANSWEEIVATVYKFYCNQIVHSFLLEASHSINDHTQQ